MYCKKCCVSPHPLRDNWQQKLSDLCFTFMTCALSVLPEIRAVNGEYQGICICYYVPRMRVPAYRLHLCYIRNRLEHKTISPLQLYAHCKFCIWFLFVRSQDFVSYSNTHYWCIQVIVVKSDFDWIKAETVEFSLSILVNFTFKNIQQYIKSIFLNYWYKAK